ncbi:putative 7 alpha-cephem-methoxylase [Annulohypoxylon moriforme]|nr:putative 7 alpha-cephem-methoxylase [Annulohypoxylon moriforme]
MTTDTLAQFSYFQWKDIYHKEKPYYLYIDPPEGVPVANFSTAPGPNEVVHNLRGVEDRFNLDDNGFTVKHQEFCLETIDEDAVKKFYLPSLETLLRELLGSDAEIFWFDWRTRSSDKSKTTFSPGTKINLDDRTIDLAPVTAVHVDQTKVAAVNRVHRHMGKRAEELLKGRVRIINIWRPYDVCVESYPIAVLDGSTVPPEKLVDVDVVRQSYIGESYYPLQHDGYQWYFVDKQTKEDVLLFKMYDSCEVAKAKCCPHASFNQRTTGESKPRQSIEARALVFTAA